MSWNPERGGRGRLTSMSGDPPSVVVLAGPNGAGKSTAAPHLLREEFGIDEFVNADEIAKGLSAFAPDQPAFAAGRIMLRRISALADARRTFAFETTLASRMFAHCLSGCAHAAMPRISCSCTCRLPTRQSRV
jgi:predicted ABC-type ATPase